MAAVIPALEPDLRPAYITDRGPVAGSFIRTGDGDKRLTHYEVDRMCESRMQPVWDTEHVSEASVTDLDAAVRKTMVERNRAMGRGTPCPDARRTSRGGRLSAAVLSKAQHRPHGQRNG
mgnify:CR=1 FL=1